jgi:hypothetical protein
VYAQPVGAEATWPWTTEPYEVIGPSFEVVPGALALAAVDGGIVASLPGPEGGFRMIHPDGDAAGDNPLVGPLRVWVDGVELAAPQGRREGRSTRIDVDLAGAAVVRVEDAYGNAGEIDLGAPR